jgi:pyruvate formate lyase activating enzyme
MRIPATSPGGVLAAYTWCKELLHHVYVGNLSLAMGSDTVCPACGTVLITRHGYQTQIDQIYGGGCRACGRRLAIRM